MDVILRFHYAKEPVVEDESFYYITMHLGNQEIGRSETHYHALGFVDGLRYTFGAVNIVGEDVYDVEM